MLKSADRQNRKIAPVHDVLASPHDLIHEILEMRIELGCSAGEIHRLGIA